MIIINGKKKKINDYGQGSALRNIKIQFIPKKKKIVLYSFYCGFDSHAYCKESWSFHKIFISFFKNEIRASVYRKRRQLKNAFDVLKVRSNEMWVITRKRWLTLMKEVCPQWSPARVALLWQVLDENNEGKIGKINLKEVSMCVRVCVKIDQFPNGAFPGQYEQIGTDKHCKWTQCFLKTLFSIWREADHIDYIESGANELNSG